MKIMSLCGLLGYGYSEVGLKKAFEQEIDYIGVDAGSTDPGPYYLGAGKSFTNRKAVKRDISLALPIAVKRGIPFVIGTAGGAGGNVHIEQVIELVREISEEKQLCIKVAVIYSEVSKDYIKKKFKENKILPLGNNLELTEKDIDETVRFVSQIGIDPFIKALENDVDLIIAGRSCDTAIYAAPVIKEGYDHGLAFHMAKIMECGCMCAQPVSASDVLVATMDDTYFTLEPANPIRECKVDRVAAHTLYEQANPNFIYEPGGMADLRESEYVQLNERTVKVSNSKFIKADVNAIKIEGAKLVGYRTISLGGMNENMAIERIDEIIDDVTKNIVDSLGETVPADSYSINYKVYGGAGDVYLGKYAAGKIGIIIDVVADTQETSDYICALTRSRFLHFDYSGRKTTAGNLAFPYSPSDISLGPVYNFSAYHLVEVDDFMETSEIKYFNIGGKNE